MSANANAAAGQPDQPMHAASRVFVAGHRGLVGSAITRRLANAGYRDVLTRSRAELDLRDREAVRRFFYAERPEYVILAAARVGGIHANNANPADFITENLLLQTAVIDACREFGVTRLLFLGSSCIYPRLCPQPIREEYLLSGPLEPTNRPYAVAKIAGIEQCWANNRQHGTRFVAAMPTNLYGPGDNFDLQNSHVLPALLRKALAAKDAGAPQMEVWGTGTPRREFLYVDDLAEACVFLLELPPERYATLLSAEEPPLINIGAGEDLSISELAELVCRIVGYDGRLAFDASRPDGTPRKLLDIGRIRALGWQPRISLEDGIRRTYAAMGDRFSIPGRV
jgi:GDP-L-fucose synthase